MTFTQIYSIINCEEAGVCIEAGADRIGVLCQDDPNGPYPCGVPLEGVKEIYDFIGDRAVKVLISVKDNADDVLKEAVYLQPDVLHLCAEFHGDKAFRERMKEVVPNTLLMEAVGVCDESSIEDAKKKAEYSDIIILDTKFVEVPGIGATGATHDWEVDRKIVEAVDVPVIMAGGLGCDNVIAAIEAVHPAGVDSLTKTSVKKDGKLLHKDYDKVREFCRLVQEHEKK